MGTVAGSAVGPVGLVDGEVGMSSALLWLSPTVPPPARLTVLTGSVRSLINR